MTSVSARPMSSAILTLVAHECGTGPFLLTTRAVVSKDGELVALRCTHRFVTEGGREMFRKAAEEFNIFESESEATK